MNYAPNTVEEAKSGYLKSLGDSLSNPRTGAKKYWTALKKLLNGYIATVIPPIILENIFITDIVEKCKIFNDFFSKQSKNIITNITLPPF